MTEPHAEASGFALRGVSVRHPDRTVLSDIGLDVPGDGITVIAGPSGAGKSSLLRLFNRLDAPAAGIISFDGVDLSALDPCILRRTVGFVFQHPVAFIGTVADNLRVADPGLDDQGVDALLDRVGLAGFAGRDAEALSGGEAQRMCLARALATQPRVILADEPTSALDADARDTLERLAHTTAHATGPGRIAWIWVSHDRDQIQRLADRVIVLADGRVEASGTIAEVAAHASPVVRSIVGPPEANP